MIAEIAFASATCIVFVGLVALAIVSVWSGGKAAELPVSAGYGEASRTLAVQRPRALWPVKSDRRARSLPPDAMVRFAAEREAAGIDGLFQRPG